MRTRQIFSIFAAAAQAFNVLMNDMFKQVTDVIRNRRTVKTADMNSRTIAEEQINHLLAMADLAPTHARTEPWRFYIYTGDSLEKFCRDHAQLYWNNTSEELRKQQTFDKLAQAGDKASHLIVTVMKRTPGAKIPWIEEYAATAAAIQNMLLTAEALQIAAIWNTGGMALKQPMKDYLGLEQEDHVTGLIYLGYTDEPKKEAQRKIPLAEKIIRP